MADGVVERLVRAGFTRAEATTLEAEADGATAHDDLAGVASLSDVRAVHSSLRAQLRLAADARARIENRVGGLDARLATVERDVDLLRAITERLQTLGERHLRSVQDVEHQVSALRALLGDDLNGLDRVLAEHEDRVLGRVTARLVIFGVACLVLVCLLALLVLALSAVT